MRFDPTAYSNSNFINLLTFTRWWQCFLIIKEWIISIVWYNFLLTLKFLLLFFLFYLLCLIKLRLFSYFYFLWNRHILAYVLTSNHFLMIIIQIHHWTIRNSSFLHNIHITTISCICTMTWCSSTTKLWECFLFSRLNSIYLIIYLSNIIKDQLLCFLLWYFLVILY
jgi:hypothetical protein